MSGHPAGSDFDDDGIPLSASIPDWLHLPSDLDSRRLQAILRFSRPDGSTVFGLPGRVPERLKKLDVAAFEIGDPSLAGVMARWFPRGRSTALPSSPPPLPSDSRPDRPLAVLRADWSHQSDLLAIDHRAPGPSSLLELASRGRVWLGPSWTSVLREGKTSRPKPVSWTSTPFAQSIEWSFSVGSARVSRSLTLLRGRSISLLGEHVTASAGSAEIRLAVADGIEPTILPNSRVIKLSAGPGKPSAWLVPLGLPDHDRPTDRGSIAIEGREVVIRQNDKGRKVYIPVLVAWDKPPRTWRLLTVAARSRSVASDQAFACRVAWGLRDAGLVIYRSLAPATLRSFLGSQTSARFLIGSFSRTGEISPILKVES